jgi:hypothetical protein
MRLITLNTILIACAAALGLSLGMVSTSFADNPYALYINSAKENYNQDQVQPNNDLQGQPESSTQKVCGTLNQDKDDFISQMSVNSDSKNSANSNNPQTKQQLLAKQKLLQKQISDCVSS